MQNDATQVLKFTVSKKIFATSKSLRFLEPVNNKLKKVHQFCKLFGVFEVEYMVNFYK